ncbi:DNA polymerase III subunit alpha, partial [bacterium]|nr:DNA polymerase III subunit alpha [bacterium]
MGFDDYFLIVYDYVLFAKKNDIMVGVGRGSAVGSLVSYSLGITDIDPMPYHLLFERFLNPDRVTMPDIDIDFEEKRREDVITYVKNRYGMDKVSHIITFGTLKSRLVIRSVGKALNINPSLIDSFTRLLDARLTLKENLQNQNLLQKTLENQSLKELTKYALALEGLKKHISVHAAGVVISSEPLDNVIPVRYLNNERLTGFTMNYLEDLGLLKMDFLVITNLDIIKNVTNLIYEETKQKINLRNINLSDDNVLKCFREGDTLGVFQFDSEGMKNFLMQLKPTSFQDMINAIALYRPGPMDNIPKFIKRKEKKEAVTYPHPDLEPILKETYGIIVYQEQIMQILSLMGGFTYAEADTIRRAMSKKKKDKIEMFREKFIMGATTKGYDKALASEVYELISKFANYGFNKSHSVAYAYMGYLMAYLKCYYPLYFITSILNMSLDSTTKTQEYLALAKRYKIKVLPPDIN